MMAEEDDKKLERENDEAMAASDQSASDDDAEARSSAHESGDGEGSAGRADGGDSPGTQTETDSDWSQREAERIAARERRAIEREERELAEAQKADRISPITGLLGIERWVQFTFLAVGVITFYLSDALITFAWERFAEPDSTIVTGTSLIVGILVAFALYRHARTNEFVFEVVGELAKVTWPTREETYYSTLVVIVTSVIAAIYTGVFDALWSAFTDLIYNYNV